ncbi:hypothetical protein V9T40_014728 [Parthenolecanium corni]|uniref:Uncharacterized protein n=1 Tax=Parthenolecanium corni TaxID=536013 RepID=A0AAN9T4F7_9HEMI
MMTECCYGTMNAHYAVINVIEAFGYQNLSVTCLYNTCTFWKNIKSITSTTERPETEPNATPFRGSRAATILALAKGQNGSSKGD